MHDVTSQSFYSLSFSIICKTLKPRRRSSHLPFLNSIQFEERDVYTTEMLASLSPIFVDPQDFPLKFFVTKGPHRKEIRELIQVRPSLEGDKQILTTPKTHTQLHGGEVTVSRAGAFMCLGVPGEKHDGANFHSTEFVADCIEVRLVSNFSDMSHARASQAGQLLEMDGYKLQSENDSPVKKSTGKRVPYTAEDHTLLKDWIRSTSESVTGNKLFINLAQKVCPSCAIKTAF